MNKIDIDQVMINYSKTRLPHWITPNHHDLTILSLGDKL